ncbi:MAG: TAXI family TRAP transporter solute-binding subunit, partial [Alphaproteobacteria bacterium]
MRAMLCGQIAVATSRLTLLATAAVVALAAGAAAQNLPPTVTLGTSQTGTLQHGVATGLAKVASAKIGSTVVVQPFSGATTALPLVESGEIDLGLAPSVDVGMSFYGPDHLKIGGVNPYPRAPRVRLVMAGSPLIASLVVKKDSPIKSAKDLKGRRIAGEFRASLGAYINTYVHLASANLTWKDVTVVPFSGLNDALDALVQGRVEATVYGVGGARIREVDSQVGVRWASSDCSTEGAERIRKTAPGYYTINLKAGSAPGVHEDFCTTAYSLYLFAGDKTPDHVVTAVVKALWDDADKLAPLHPA